MNCFKKENAPEIVFRKWGRKNYSLFSTLKKVVKISVLTVVYFLATPVVSVALEQDTTDVQMEYDLDEIEVSAKRTPAVYSEVARIVSVMSENEIEAIPAQNIQDLLEYVAAVDVRQRGAKGVQADVSIRGGTFDQTLILLNGINITDPQTGHHNLNLPVSLEQVERIEILEGPAARVYGPNAFSGAINIITKAPGSQKGTASVSGGSFGYFDANASAGFRSGKLEHLLAAGRKSSDGYIENTDFNISNLFYSNRLITESGKFSLQAGISGKAFGANSFYTPKYPEQFEQTRTLFSSAKWESFSSLHLTPVVYWRRHNDRFELFRNEAPQWYQNHNYHRTDVFGAGINSWFKWKWGRTAFGAEFRNENILSNVLGEELPAPKEVYGEVAVYTKSKTRNTSSLFFEHAWYHQQWTVTAGVMANHISESDIGINFFPGIELSYNPTRALKLFSSFNTSLRMPTFTDLYYEGPTNIGNPNLKPEKSASIEGGVRLNSSFIQGHAVFFYRRGNNIIDWVKENQDDIWQPRNLTRINSYGTEIQVQLYPEKILGKNAPERIVLSYFNNNMDKQLPGLISNYVLDNLRHKIILSGNYELVRNLSLNLSFIYQDREGTFTLYQNKTPVGETVYAPFWLTDLKLNYRYRNFIFFASGNNLLDKKYYDIGNVRQPGRWMKAGVSYSLDFN